MLTHVNSAKALPAADHRSSQLADFLQFCGDTSLQENGTSQQIAKIRLLLSLASFIKPSPQIWVTSAWQDLESYCSKVAPFFKSEIHPVTETFDIILTEKAEQACLLKLRPNGWLISRTAEPNLPLTLESKVDDWHLYRRPFTTEDYTGTMHVLIPVHNRCDLTKACLDALKKQSIADKINTIIIDDGSSDGTADMIRGSFPETTLLQGNGNLWWGGAINRGLTHISNIAAPEDFVIFLNNDVLLQPETLETLLRLSLKDRAALWAPAGLSSGEAIASGERGHIPYRFEQIEAHFSQKQRRLEVEGLFGRCSMMPAALIMALPAIDTATFPHYYGDTDYFLKAQKLGYSCHITGQTYIHVQHDENNTGTHHSFYEKARNLKEIIDFLSNQKSLSNLKYIYRFYSRYAPAEKWRHIFRVIWSAIKNHSWLRGKA